MLLLQNILKGINKIVKKLIRILSSKIAEEFISGLVLQRKADKEVEILGTIYNETLDGALTNLKIAYKEFLITLLLAFVQLLGYLYVKTYTAEVEAKT